jgi:catechol 2,3-dioxygenase-like lactoylglutathione lyase family enzyme
MDRPSHAGLRHVALNVTRLEDMKAFYVDLLGFRVEWEPDADNVYLSSGIDNLAFHRAPVEAADAVATGRLDHLGIIVRQPSDVDRWATYLKSQGITIDTEPRTHRDGARSCYFRDPDGNRIQIIHHPPISGES